MITDEEARKAANEIMDYCDNQLYGCDKCAIYEFCNSVKNKGYCPRAFTKYKGKTEKSKYSVMLEIALPVEATTIEEAQKLAERQVRTAFPVLYHDDVSTEDVWQMPDEEEDK